jgi:hypothetical protein
MLDKSPGTIIARRIALLSPEYAAASNFRLPGQLQAPLSGKHHWMSQRMTHPCQRCLLQDPGPKLQHGVACLHAHPNKSSEQQGQC